MVNPDGFVDKEALVSHVLAYYRQENTKLAGPTEATLQLWPTLVRRIAPKLLRLLAQERLADLVGKRATNPRGEQHGWDSAGGTLTVHYASTAPDVPPESVQVPITRVPWTGPTMVYPKILITQYVTEAGAKFLLYFTVRDCEFCIGRWVDMRNGLDRHIGAMHHARQLLEQHQAAVLADLPPAVLDAFAKQWENVLRKPPKTSQEVA